MARLSPAAARAFAAALLEASGADPDSALPTADCLVEAETEGQASHGLGRLPFLLRRLRQGLIEGRPVMRLIGDRPAAALLDAGNGLGPAAGVRAMSEAAERARLLGVGACAVRSSNHLGAVSYYVRRPAAEGLLALACGNTPPAMAVPGGRTALLGTNPLAAGIPAGGEPAVVDMATSQVARGRILAARRAGRPIPAGWALDPEGRETTDPEAAIEGTLAPMGGAKGFALALLVEALSGVLAGAALSPEVSGTFIDSDRPSNVGHLFLALDPSAFLPGFAERMEGLASLVRAEGRLPGDRRAELRRRAETEGIAVDQATWDQLLAAARELGLATPPER